MIRNRKALKDRFLKTLDRLTRSKTESEAFIPSTRIVREMKMKGYDEKLVQMVTQDHGGWTYNR